MERLLSRVVSVLAWTAVVLLGLFGLYFTFANYPVFGITVTLAIVIVVGYLERGRRRRRQERDSARRRARAQIDAR